MRVVLTNPRGFCAGVRMAIEVVDRAVGLFPDRAFHVYHEIVHNRHVVGRFRDRGVVFVDNLADVPRGGIVVFSAHGVSPAIRRQATDLGLIAIDATCPLVTKVHSEAVRYARQGYQILLIGHADHQEVVGTRGEAPDAIQVVERVEDIPRLVIRDPARLVYLTQTTLSTDDAAVIIDALRAAFPGIKAPPTEDICYATTNRQHAVRQLAPQCDLVLVVGSRNSSNSVRLTEISRNVGTPAFLLDDVTELREEWFVPRADGRRGEGDRSDELVVLLTAGASAPEDLVAGICRQLLATHGGTVEQWDVFDEDVEFALPVALRRLMTERGVEPPAGGIRVGKPVVTEAAYGGVPLTVSAGRRA
ncbi:MAG: 4-hydroxy-3-methylbut-2-enyl diphosphate reductase [Phycisphaerae bacterium]|nr:4-hydroxy-3-methylbut-2-enyl diphosphate reductase [Phycisphaerae bacterium]